MNIDRTRWENLNTETIKTKKRINVVLYSPEIPQNTGNISRTCAVTGAALHIIRPIGFEISDKTLKRAGLDYWDKLEIYYYDSYEEFESKCTDGEHYYYSAKGKRCYADVEYPDNVYLIFGKETAGLPDELLERGKDRVVRVPMLDDRRCLNLSNTVAIAVYEAIRQSNFSGFAMERRL